MPATKNLASVAVGSLLAAALFAAGCGGNSDTTTQKAPSSQAPTTATSGKESPEGVGKDNPTQVPVGGQKDNPTQVPVGGDKGN